MFANLRQSVKRWPNDTIGYESDDLAVGTLTS